MTEIKIERNFGQCHNCVPVKPSLLRRGLGVVGRTALGLVVFSLVMSIVGAGVWAVIELAHLIPIFGVILVVAVCVGMLGLITHCMYQFGSELWEMRK